jgi:hypothetical protein
MGWGLGVGPRDPERNYHQNATGVCCRAKPPSLNLIFIVPRNRNDAEQQRRRLEHDAPQGRIWYLEYRKWLDHS